MSALPFEDWAPSPDLVPVMLTRQQAKALHRLVTEQADRLPADERVALRAILSGAVHLPSGAAAEEPQK